ncbi:hypothetical protein BsWGS_19686 [Bradybaena similaris]
MKTIATNDEFNQIISTTGLLVVVDFYATWCGPCNAIGPQVERWSQEFNDVIFLKIDVDENDETAEQCGISAMPTFQFYKGGQKIDEIVGANQDKIKDKILQLK